MLLLALKLSFRFRTEASLLDIVHLFLEVGALSLFVFRSVKVFLSRVTIVIEYWLSIVKYMLLSFSDFKLDRSYLIDGASERRHCFLVVDLLRLRFRIRCYFAYFDMTVRRD